MKDHLARSELTLRRIAESIGVDMRALELNAGAPETELAQSAALLRSFLRIRDPEIRKTCLAFVRRAAAASTTERS